MIQVKWLYQTPGENVRVAEAGRAEVTADTPAYQASAGSLMRNQSSGNVRTASDMYPDTWAATHTSLENANGEQLPLERGGFDAVRTPDQGGSKQARIQLQTCQGQNWA